METIIRKSQFNFTTILLIILFSSTGCKKNNSKNNKKNIKSAAIVKDSTKNSVNKQTNKKNPNSSKKSGGNLYVRLELTNLFSIPFIQSKTEKLKLASSKNGFLGNLLRCGADFTSNINIIAISLPRDFRTTKTGALSIKGSFNSEKLLKCLPGEMGWKKLPDKNSEKIFSSSNFTIHIKTPSKGVVMFRTSKWNHIFTESLPRGFEIFSHKINQHPPLLVGMLNPDVPWKKRPKAVLIGVDANLINLKFRTILNFEQSEDATWFEGLAKNKILDFIKKYKQSKDAKAIMIVKLLKKTGVKRKNNQLLSLLKIPWNEVSELIKIAKVTITAKQ
jgi:hypothetical protein